MPSVALEKLKRLTINLKTVDGDFAEVGVARGGTFQHVIQVALSYQKAAHAYDSFIGMNSPSANDAGQYPKGKFDVGGVAGFNTKMQKLGCHHSKYKTFPGYIPECFNGVDAQQRYSFIYLDVDHYEATKIALPWCWDRLNIGGMLLLDDYVVNKTALASLAINEWLATVVDEYDYIELSNTQLAITKTVGR